MGRRPKDAGLRGMPAHATGPGDDRGCGRSRARASAAAQQGDRPAHPRPLPLHADRRPGPRHRRDRRRPVPRPGDEPPAPGRRGVRQDRRGPVRGPAGRGQGQAGRHHGPDRNPGQPALSEDPGLPGRLAGPHGTAGGRTGGRPAGSDSGRPGRRKDRPGRRHARAVERGRAFRAPGAGGGGRAAQVRRPPAENHPRQRVRPALPGDDGHAHPPHAGDDGIRRPGRLGAGRLPARPRQDHHPLRGRGADRRGDEAGARASSRPVSRRTSSTRWWRPRPTWSSRPPRTPTASFPPVRWGDSAWD